MLKILLKITFIICANLLAFLSIWLILDALFQTDGVFLLISVLVSFPVFGMIMYLKSGKILRELHTYNQYTNGSK